MFGNQPTNQPTGPGVAHSLSGCVERCMAFRTTMSLWSSLVTPPFIACCEPGAQGSVPSCLPEKVAPREKTWSLGPTDSLFLVMFGRLTSMPQSLAMDQAAHPRAAVYPRKFSQQGIPQLQEISRGTLLCSSGGPVLLMGRVRILNGDRDNKVGLDQNMARPVFNQLFDSTWMWVKNAWIPQCHRGCFTTCYVKCMIFACNFDPYPALGNCVCVRFFFCLLMCL